MSMNKGSLTTRCNASLLFNFMREHEGRWLDFVQLQHLTLTPVDPYGVRIKNESGTLSEIKRLLEENPDVPFRVEARHESKKRHFYRLARINGAEQMKLEL